MLDAIDYVFISSFGDFNWMQARDITEFEKSFCRFQIGQVSDTQVDLNQSWAVTDTTLDIRVHETLNPYL